MAMFIIFLAEFNYEYNNNVIYEGFTGAGTGAGAGAGTGAGADSPTITAINNGISSYNQDYNILIICSIVIGTYFNFSRKKSL